LTHFGKHSGPENVRKFPFSDLRVPFIESTELKNEHLINNLHIVYTNWGLKKYQIKLIYDISNRKEQYDRKTKHKTACPSKTMIIVN